MSNGRLLQVKLKGGDWGDARINRADAQLASLLPQLNRPRMNEEARAAFRSVLDHEAPSGNGSLIDFLALAEARGFCAHPLDWIPSFDDDPQHPLLYQPWVDWLSEKGLTPFHAGNTLTRENWDRWKPKPRLRAFKKLVQQDQRSAFDLLVTVEPAQSAATRLALLGEIDAGGSFHGNYPRQVPILKHFLADRSDKVRALAEKKLSLMNGMETEAAHAEELAKHIKVMKKSVSYISPVPPHTYPFWKNYACTTFDCLAYALGITPEDLARYSDLEDLGENFMSCVVVTGGLESRSIVASRLLDMNKAFASRLFRGGGPPALGARIIRYI